MATSADDRLYGHAKDCADELEMVGVTNAHALLRDWIRRKKLKAIAEFDGRPVYAMTDVFRVELATRRNGKRGRRLDKSRTISHA
jgi:hypothetical protein